MALAGVLVVAGCREGDDGDGTPVTPGAAGLVVLAGEPGAATLTSFDAAGAARAVSLPAPSTAWISVGRQGAIVATLDDGTVRLADEVRADRDPAWREVPGPDVELPREPLWFATWSPNGRRFAALATDFGADGNLTLAIVDPVGDASLLLPVPRRPLVAAPSWLDDERVLVQTTIGVAVVDTSTGDVASGPQDDLDNGVALAVADDGSLVAMSDPAGGAVSVGTVEAWFAGRGPEVRLEGQGEVGSVGFDRRAERLAVVWQQPEGPGTLVVYRRGDGWREAHRSTLPGESARAVVDWRP